MESIEPTRRPLAQSEAVDELVRQMFRTAMSRLASRGSGRAGRAEPSKMSVTGPRMMCEMNVYRPSSSGSKLV